MKNKSSYAWVVWLGMAFLTIASTGIMYNCMSLFTAPILEAFPEWTRAQFSMASTFQLIFTCVMMLTIGKLVGKFGPKKVLIFGEIILILHLYIASIAKSLPMFYLSYALFGIANGAIAIAVAPVLINTWFAKKQGSLLGGISTIGNLVGVVFASLVGIWIGNVGYQAAYRYLLVVIAVLGILGCILVKDKPNEGVLPMWYDPKEDTPVAASPADLPGVTAKEAMKQPAFYMIWVSVFLMSGAFSAVMQLMSVYAVADLGFSAAAAGTIMSVYCFANAGFQVPVGAMCDKLGAKPVFVLGTGIFAVASVLLVLLTGLPSWLMYVVSALIAIAMIIPLVPTQMLCIQVFGPKDAATIIGYVFTASALGGAVLLPIFNTIYDKTGTYAMAWILAVACAAVALVLIMLATRKKSA